MNWDYIAGFFDGEGSVIIYHDKRRAGKKDIYVRLQIGQTDKETHDAIRLFLLSEDIDFTTYTHIRKDNHKTCYYIKIGKQEHIKEFCTHIMEHSITKLDKLEEALVVISRRCQ